MKRHQFPLWSLLFFISCLAAILAVVRINSFWGTLLLIAVLVCWGVVNRWAKGLWLVPFVLVCIHTVLLAATAVLVIPKGPNWNNSDWLSWVCGLGVLVMDSPIHELIGNLGYREHAPSYWTLVSLFGTAAWCIVGIAVTIVWRGLWVTVHGNPTGLSDFWGFCRRKAVQKRLHGDCAKCRKLEQELTELKAKLAKVEGGLPKANKNPFNSS